MGFFKGNIATIWSIDVKDNLCTANISTSKKNKDSGEYFTDFNDGFVSFVGTANERLRDRIIPEGGIKIRIGNGDVTHYYDKNKQKLYVNYTVFSFDDIEWDSENKQWVTLNSDDETSAKKNTKSSSKTKSKTTKAKKQPEQQDDDEDEELPF